MVLERYHHTFPRYLHHIWGPLGPLVSTEGCPGAFGEMAGDGQEGEHFAAQRRAESQVTSWTLCVSENVGNHHAINGKSHSWLSMFNVENVDNVGNHHVYQAGY